MDFNLRKPQLGSVVKSKFKDFKRAHQGYTVVSTPGVARSPFVLYVRKSFPPVTRRLLVTQTNKCYV